MSTHRKHIDYIRIHTRTRPATHQTRATKQTGDSSSGLIKVDPPAAGLTLPAHCMASGSQSLMPGSEPDAEVTPQLQHRPSHLHRTACSRSRPASSPCSQGFITNCLAHLGWPSPASTQPRGSDLPNPYRYPTFGLASPMSLQTSVPLGSNPLGPRDPEHSWCWMPCLATGLVALLGEPCPQETSLWVPSRCCVPTHSLSSHGWSCDGLVAPGASVAVAQQGFT